MWLPRIIALVLTTTTVLSIPQPGLLRVPKVYNAVITSNQNLAPSRAYPVVQPVVHRTAIGYVPPFYYTQLSPNYGGPEFAPLGPIVPQNGAGNRDRGTDESRRRRPEEPPPRPDEVESVEITDSNSRTNSSPPKKISQSRSSEKSKNSDDADETTSAESSERSSSVDDERDVKRVKNERVPINFYPNYQSLYYDPYFYPYNAFPPHLAAPGTYYVDYPQPPGLLGPLPPPLPPPLGPPNYPGADGRRPENPNEPTDGQSDRRDEKQKFRNSDKREKIPDVPPPPLPNSMKKKSS